MIFVKNIFKTAILYFTLETQQLKYFVKNDFYLTVHIFTIFSCILIINKMKTQ